MFLIGGDIMKTILFVCTGNTCRSSMAEGFFNDAVKNAQSLSEMYKGESAGLAAFEGEPAAQHSVNVMKNIWNIDISGHRARNLDRDMVNRADLILTMTKGHKEMIISKFPGSESKVFTLKEFIHGKNPDNGEEGDCNMHDVADPYGMPEQVYRKCAEEIKKAVDMLVEKLGT